MSESLSFNGERFLPECVGEIRYEHWHRYALARQLGALATVLDVASGEGYGAAMLAESAARVVGVDISPEAVRHAINRYGNRANLEFVTASCDRLPFADASFDLAVSFETIEHINTQQEFIAELARILRPDGVLLLSSPNKHVYSDAHDYHNEFHVRELYRNELEELLLKSFPHIRWFGQKLLFHSVIWPEGSAVVETEYLADDGQQIAVVNRPPVEPMYYITACSRNPTSLPAVLNRISLFGDVTETVYQDYARQTRRVMELDNLVGDRERLIAERDEFLTLRTQQMEQREHLIAERDELLTLRNEQLDGCNAQLEACNDQLAGLQQQVTGLQQQVAGHQHQAAGHQHQAAGYQQHLATINQQLDHRTSLAWWLKLPLRLIRRAFKADD